MGAARKTPKRASTPVAAKTPVKKRKVAQPKLEGSGVLTAIHKRLGKGAETFAYPLAAGNLLSDVKEWIPSGFPGLDYILGGGWAVGRASEVSGPEGSGKSALTHRALSGVQSIGGRALVLDFELALDSDKLARLDIDPNAVDVVYPHHIEEAWNVVYTALAELRRNPPKAPFLIVWDSIAAAPAKAQVELKSQEDHTVAAQARAISMGVKRMYREIAEVRAHMMWVNQERVKMNAVAFGQQTNTPGGMELKFAASQRVRCVVVKRLKGTTEGALATGYLVKTITSKCRNFPPHRSAEWVLDFEHGPSPELTMWFVLLDAGVLVRTKGSYTVKGVEGTFSKKGWLDFLAEPVTREAVTTIYLDIVSQGGAKAFREKGNLEED